MLVIQDLYLKSLEAGGALLALLMLTAPSVLVAA